jgi:hypothetical protein
MFLVMTSTPVIGETKVKQVCHQQKGKEVCKEVKIHKKHDGHKVPDAKKKK